MIEVLECRPDTFVEDLGRPGLSALGVSRSGAADRSSLTLANRLVGNAEHAAGLELTLGGLSLRFDHPATLAVTGAEVAMTAPGVRRLGMNCPFDVAPGSVLRLSTPPRGLRTYVAVRGGVDVPPVLGSRATDVLSGLGPPRVTAGTTLRVGDLAIAPPGVDLAPVLAVPRRYLLTFCSSGNSSHLFRDGWMSSSSYTVGQNSNRIAVRLVGRAIRRADDRETPPQGLVPGAVQVPSDGQPLIFLADHPVTGGYPVAGVLTEESIRVASQLRSGDSVELRRL